MANVTFSFASGLNDTVFGKCQVPVRAMIEQKAQAWEQMSALKHIFNFGNSKHFGERISSMTGMDGFQPVGEGGAFPVDGMQEGFHKDIVHQTWKDSFSVTREAMEDGKIMDLKKKPKTFINGYYATREHFGATMLAGGLGSSVLFKGKSFDTTTADGKPLFAKDHPSAIKDSGVAAQSNKFAGAFSNDNLAKLETKMQNFVDDKGEPLAISPNTIIIPNDAMLKKEVFAAIGADKDPATANNGFNFTFGRYTVIVWQYLNSLLSGADKPFILLDSDYNETYEGADWLERVQLEVDSYVDNGNSNNVWNGRARFGVGFNDFRAFAIGGVASGTNL